MAAQTLMQKLQLKPDFTLLVLNAPSGMTDLLPPADSSAQAEPYDAVIVFVQDAAAIVAHAAAAVAAIKPDGVLWFAYPKKTGAIKTDIHRDVGWQPLTALGWDGVRQIAIDSTWSALRFRPVSAINYTLGSTRRPKTD